MIFEYRRYEACPGRMDSIVDRFREHTVPMWSSRGIHAQAFWRPLTGDNNMLHYGIRWESLAERQDKWDSFATDPDWLAIKSMSERHGPLIANVHNELWTEIPMDPTFPPNRAK